MPTIPQPPERTATAAELAEEGARIERARAAAPQRPRYPTAAEAAILRAEHDAVAAGPFDTERQARELPAVRAVYDATRASARPGSMDAHCLAILEGACTAAGVGLGAYDRRILAWLAGWEPHVVAVVAGLITRAAASGDTR